MSLGRKLRILRGHRGLSLRGAADVCGVTEETLSALERGIREPHDPTLAKIAKGYGISFEELLVVKYGAYGLVKGEKERAAAFVSDEPLTERDIAIAEELIAEYERSVKGEEEREEGGAT